MVPRIFLAFFLIEAMCVDLGLKRMPRYLQEETLSRVVQLTFTAGSGRHEIVNIVRKTCI